MAKHGWQKVRGGFWSNICEKSTRGGLIHHGKTHVLYPPPINVPGADQSQSQGVPEQNKLGLGDGWD